VTADATPAWTAWSATDDETKRQVSELAAQGRRHTDERVASAAHAWAEVVINDGDDRRTPDWLGRIVGLLLALLTGPDPVGSAQERAQDQVERHSGVPRCAVALITLFP
jgi:hypothetical protein